MKIWGSILILSLLLVGFQNCGQVGFVDSESHGVAQNADGGGDLDVCNGVSCELDPLTQRPSVITILMALGDEADDQLVVNGLSAQLIAETVVRYASPVSDPRILIVLDAGASNEDPEDTIYVREVLLARYKTVFLEEPATGLSDADVSGFDLIWFNNPGHAMKNEVTRDVLMRFAGGVILQGDDLSRGASFDLSALTGLTHVDNGATVVCGGKSYSHDNNGGERYRVELDPAKMPSNVGSAIRFEYGNDIDLAVPARSDLEILAYARGGPSVCSESRPAIVRYMK